LNLLKTTYLDFFITTVINIGFFIIQIALLWLYFKVVKKVKTLNEVLGIGDLVFLLISTLFMSVSGFMTFYILGICISLFLAIILKWNTKTSTVPLAGILSVELAGILLLQYFKVLNLRSEFLIW
jgi:hypothetical protein